MGRRIVTVSYSTVWIHPAGTPIPLEAEVFSRDCFPDPLNPGVDEADTEVGCHDAADFEEFFNQRIMGGLAGVEGVEAELTGQQGCVCFCDGDGCNDQDSVDCSNGKEHS